VLSIKGSFLPILSVSLKTGITFYFKTTKEGKTTKWEAILSFIVLSIAFWCQLYLGRGVKLLYFTPLLKFSHRFFLGTLAWQVTSPGKKI